MVSTIRVLSENDIEQLLALGDALEIVNLMADALAAYTLSRSDPDKHKDAQAPHRLTVTTDNHKVLFMPSRLGTTTSVKIVSVPLSDNSKTGLPGTTVVLNEDTGEVEAVMNAAALTAVRTAAGTYRFKRPWFCVGLIQKEITRICFGNTLLRARKRPGTSCPRRRSPGPRSR